LLKQQPAIVFYMIQVQDSGSFPLQQSLEHRLSLDERQRPKIFAVEIQQVKSDE
jgi:hypothetical protein